VHELQDLIIRKNFIADNLVHFPQILLELLYRSFEKIIFNEVSSHGCLGLVDKTQAAKSNGNFYYKK
jgi:hypothetical protein